jgi:peptide/nickel transport system permease protein
MAEIAQSSMAQVVAFPAAVPRKRRKVPVILRSPLTVVGLVIIVVFVFVAVAAPVIAPFDPNKQNLSQRLKPPTAQHLLGTDSLGRDLLSRIIWGARISLTIGSIVVVSASVFGTLVGLIAGYRGGFLDDALMRITDIFFAFPPLILAMAIAAALGPSLNTAMIAIAVVTWPVYARLVRGQVLALRKREFVEAAESIGASGSRIIRKHLLPNSLSPLLVQASFDLGGAILIAAGLSFIGFGAQPPLAEWGVMISDGRKYVSTHPWLPLFPGLAILFTVAAFNLIGDGLKDALDPRLRGNL